MKLLLGSGGFYKTEKHLWSNSSRYQKQSKKDSLVLLSILQDCCFLGDFQSDIDLNRWGQLTVSYELRWASNNDLAISRWLALCASQLFPWLGLSSIFLWGREAFGADSFEEFFDSYRQQVGRLVEIGLWRDGPGQILCPSYQVKYSKSRNWQYLWRVLGVHFALRRECWRVFVIKC